MSEHSRADQAPEPPGRDPEVVIRLTADGRVYFHDITAGIARIASDLAPDDRAMARRAELAEAANGTPITTNEPGGADV